LLLKCCQANCSGQGFLFWRNFSKMRSLKKKSEYSRKKIPLFPLKARQIWKKCYFGTLMPHLDSQTDVKLETVNRLCFNLVAVFKLYFLLFRQVLKICCHLMVSLLGLNIWNLNTSHLWRLEMWLNMAFFHCFLKKWRFRNNQGNKWQNVGISGFPGGWDVKIGHQFIF
jgi:hypothetical protein